MRLACLILLSFLIPACALRPTRSPAPVAHGEEPALVDQQLPHEPQAEPASALVFDPLASPDEPGIDFPRDPRSQGAYWGIQGPTQTFFYQRTDDRYGSGWDFEGFGDTYRRRTIETRIGTSVR
jgi:hypothetical protein